jgi:hypothetical protein
VERSARNKEWRIVVLASFVTVLFCGLLNNIWLENFTKQGICFLYFFGFTLLPTTLYGIQRYGGFFTETGTTTASGWAALALNLLFCLWIVAFPDRLALLSGTYYLLMAYFLLMVLRSALFNTNNVRTITITPDIDAITSGVIFGIVLLGFLNTFVTHMWFDVFDGIIVEIPHWGGWPAILLGVFALVGAYVLWWRKVQATETHSGWTLLVCFSPVLLFSIQNSFDTGHYDALIAPAIAVLHGKVPLVDVFCQYGLGYLLLTLAFWVLPNTYAVCAVIVSLMNIWVSVLYLLMLRLLIKNPYAFSIMGVASVFGTYFCNEISTNLVPSALSFRYLPALLFLYFLLMGKSLEENRLNRQSNIGFLLLNAFWSAECLIFYFLIAGCYRWLMTYSIKEVFISTGKLLFKLMCGLLVFFGIYLLLFKKIPNYLIYFEYPLSYLTGRNDRALFYEQIDPFSERYLFFVPMALLSIMIFYWNIFGSKRKTKDLIFNRLCLTNFSGIIFFVYIAVHSFVFFIKLEFTLFLLPFFGALWFIREKTKNAIFKFLSDSLIWVTCLVFFCIFITRTFYIMPSNLGSNDALIYHLVHYKPDIFKNFWYNLNNFCSKSSYREKNNSKLAVFLQNSCQRYDFNQEVKDVISRHYKDRHDVLIFSDSIVEILFENHKYHAIFVDPMNDSGSDSTKNKIIDAKIDARKYGDIVVIDKNIGLDKFQSNILIKLWKKFGFKNIDETPHLWICQLIEKTDDGSPWFLAKNNFVRYLGKNGMIDHSKQMNMTSLDLTGYFKNKDVLTIEMDFDPPILVDGIKIWHVLSAKDLLKYRFFSNNAMKTFDVLTSVDGKKWNVALSEENYFINNKKYYYKNIVPIRAKYIRFNAVIDSPILVLSPLEVFGKDQ